MATTRPKSDKVLADTSDHQVTFARVAREAGHAAVEFGGPLKGLIDIIGGGTSPVKDITELLGDAGITVDQWTRRSPVGRRPPPRSPPRSPRPTYR